MTQIQETVKDIVFRYAERTADNRLSFFPDIPPARLAEALTGYGNRIDADDVLVLLDNTDTGSAREGAVLTADAIYTRNPQDITKELKLRDLRTVALTGTPVFMLLLNDRARIKDILVRPENMHLFADMLTEIADAMRAQSGTDFIETVPAEKPVQEWLDSVGMSRYADLFRENRIGFSHLPGLTDDNLRDMGISALGDRRTILDGITRLHTEEQQNLQTEAARECAGTFDRRCLKTAAFLLIVCAVIGALTDDPNGLWVMPLLGAAGAVALYLYSLPAVIAFRKGHPHRWAILIANWVLGATGIVWIILFCYSLGLIGSGSAVTLGYFTGRD